MIHDPKGRVAQSGHSVFGSDRAHFRFPYSPRKVTASMRLPSDRLDKAAYISRAHVGSPGAPSERPGGERRSVECSTSPFVFARRQMWLPLSGSYRLHPARRLIQNRDRICRNDRRGRVTKTRRPERYQGCS